MRKFFFLLAPMVLSALLATSCFKMDNDGNDVVWDIYPVVIKMYVTDQNGEDILDPNNASALKPEDISLTYLDKEYTCQNGLQALQASSTVETKAYLPKFYGLWRQAPYNNEPKYSLFFGELEGEKRYDNESFILKIGEDVTHTITLKRDFKWEDDGSPTVNQKWYLDGTEAQLPFTIVLK
jgi:hypothetical protein